MRKLLHTLSIAIITINAVAQAPSIEWQKSYGGTYGEWARAVQQTSDGGYVILGFSNSNDGDVTGNHAGSGDYWVVKTDNVGTIQWQKSLGGTDSELATSIKQTSDGGYIVAGYSQSADGDVTGHNGFNCVPIAPCNDYWVVKLDNAGVIQWNKCFGGTGNDEAYTTQQTSDGGYIVAGYSTSNNGDVSGNHGNDYWVVKTDNAGTIQWQKCYGGGGQDYASSIQQTNDAGYIIAGYSESNDGDVSGNHGGKDYWIVKTDNAGIIQWQKSLGGTFDDRANSIQQTNDGGYIVAGWSESNDGDVTGNHAVDYWVVKLDNVGSIQWQKALGGGSIDYAYSTKQTSDGGYIVAGLSESIDGDVTGNHGGGGNDDYWVVKLDNTGSLQWQKSLGGTGSDLAYSIQQTNDGGYIVVGNSDSNDGDVSGNNGSIDYWMVKLGSCSASFTVYPDPNTPHNWFVLNNTIGVLPITYNWAWGDGNFSSGTNPSHTYSLPGYYPICLTITDGNGCSSVFCDSSTYIFKTEEIITINVVDAIPTGIEETGKDAVSIYPNPATSEITVNGYSPAYLKLFNTLGQTVAEASKSNKLYVGNLSQGLYVLQVFDEKGQPVSIEKVIITK